MIKQKTLKKEFSLTGKGLHPGPDVTISFCPAPDDTGYRICRTDLCGRPVIRAAAENATGTGNRTVLSENGIQVGSVEHGLAALYASGIDNCLIKIDAAEFPVLDGSAAVFMHQIQRAGIQEQCRERVYYVADRIIEYLDETSDAHLILLPSSELKVYTQIFYDSEILDIQSAVMQSLSEFPDQIAPCRTFVFIKDIEDLLQKETVAESHLMNCIVVYDEQICQQKLDRLTEFIRTEKRDAKAVGYIMNNPSRFPNEPARHKILDIIGDLSLTGRFIKGAIIAMRPEHPVNNRFARLISAEIRKESLPDCASRAAVKA
ncbi:MAG: UDP-3-O-acyl-N-acetylglucosamine deacetylase [Tannerella sp.]|jgi:UDP-3-O-[3-hydroxymyristoyl] N-acetylglucosamine deacetylase/3-hydroxyacyl-[acyl-carrier-protein] dehydratase|nr:UDP-3-O-acyl-N-acetylglucosamine deacetylase [Tannerella sp.]